MNGSFWYILCLYKHFRVCPKFWSSYPFLPLCLLIRKRNNKAYWIGILSMNLNIYVQILFDHFLTVNKKERCFDMIMHLNFYYILFLFAMEILFITKLFIFLSGLNLNHPFNTDLLLNNFEPQYMFKSID